jgi:nucleotide-binding universal stress UspA family protein
MYSKILVPVDGSDTSKLGVREAIRLAKALKTPARLRLLHVVDDFPMLMGVSSVTNYEKARAALREHGDTVLEQARQLAAAADVQVDVHLREVTGARIATAVIAEANHQGCDLIVMGTHGRRGLSRVALGSDADHVVGLSPVPVLLVRARGHVEDPAAAPAATKVNEEPCT